MLKTIDFSSRIELVKFVNDNSVPQANIVRIMERDGQWILFYWE